MLRRLCVKNGSQLMREIPWIIQGQHSSYIFLKSLVRLEACTPPHKSYFSSAVRYFAQSPSFPSKAAFEEICSETLESLTDCFEELVERADHLEGTDVNYSDGVLTIQFGEPYGTYVINRQSPNRQIWLSSPTSGPKRYDYIEGEWVYHHDGVSLHQLLSEEISKILKVDVNFNNFNHSRHSGK